MKLNDFTPWQWELAIVVSRFELGLLSDTEIIAFTHKLMVKGYYDDIMLDIIDDDPLYHFRDKQNIVKDFHIVLQNLDLEICENSANWLLNFVSIFPSTVRPYDFNYSYIEEFNYYLSYDCNHFAFKDDDDIHSAYDKVLDNYDETPVGISPLQDQQLIESIAELYQEYENWLTRNQSNILAIMHQLFPK